MDECFDKIKNVLVGDKVFLHFRLAGEGRWRAMADQDLISSKLSISTSMHLECESTVTFPVVYHIIGSTKLTLVHVGR